MSHLMYECVSVPFARRENSPKIHYLLIFPLSLTANKCQTQNILYKNEIRAIGLHNVGGGRPGGEWCFEKERNHVPPRSAWQRLLGVALAREDLSAKVSTK